LNDKQDAKAAHLVLQSGFWEGGGGAVAFPRWWSSLRKEAGFDPALFFIVEDATGVVGLAHCWANALIKDLVVHPRARRQGLGRALMLTAFRAFAARGEARVDLKVREDNLAAQRLYQSLDMRIIGRDAA
jgi:ribosomal protein S18 acetylase RimI-like enzyme